MTRPRISVQCADITTLRADVIVNAANRRMRGGGGVDGAIHRAGGLAILRDCIKRYPHGLATGDAGYTTAGRLPARWVVHTVGPNYRRGQRNPALLESCYRRSLEVAGELGANSVAFPLVSAGVYGWPLEDAATIAVRTVGSQPSDVEEVVFAAFSLPVLDLLKGEIQKFSWRDGRNQQEPN